MRAISPIIEHVILSAGSLAFFILVVMSFNTIQEELINDDMQNRLTNLATQTALAISQAYNTGSSLSEISADEPVTTIRMDIPQSLAGHQYVISLTNGLITASSKGIAVQVGLLGLDKQVNITGKIVGSAIRKPAVSYYKSQNLIVLENAR